MNQRTSFPPYTGQATSRVDGRAKVTGSAKYAGDHNAKGLAYGAVVASTIAHGRIAGIDTSEALRVKGVLAVITHENRPQVADSDAAWKDDVAPEQGSPFRPLYDDRVHFSEQPIALVVAEEWEIARYAGSLVRVDYDEQPFVTDIFRQRGEAEIVEKPDKPRGDAAKAFAAAAVRHEAEYFIPTEYHNPMELFASTAMWDGGGKLTVYDKTQGVQNVQKYLCGVFQKKSDEIKVLSPYMGGGFGSGLRPQYQVVLAVMGALKLERSVRLVLTRRQMYGLGYRPATIERLALGANKDGTLASITHQAIAMTSRFEDFSRNDTGWSAQLYTSANAKYEHRLAHLDAPTPCDMRAPGAATGVYALESAMDELAVALKIDPVELRLRCYSRQGPERGPALHQQGAARMLFRRRQSVRLGQAQSGAALDARRQQSGRLGHGNRRVGSAADAGRGTDRAGCERACGSCHARRPISGPAPTPSWRRSRPTARAAESRMSACALPIPRCRRRRWKADPGWRPPPATPCWPPPRKCARSCCDLRRR